MRTAHLHGVSQLTGQLINVALHTFLAAAIHSRDERAADQHAVCTQCQCFEHIHTGADAAVHQDLHTGALEGCCDLRQHLGSGRALIQYAAAVVGHHDSSRAGFLCLPCALNGHNTLDDEGALGQLDDLGKLCHALAACGRSHVLQEGQTGCVHIHGHGKAAAGLGLGHFFLNGINVPGLDGGHAAAVCCANGLGGHLHNGGVGAVAGKGSDAVLCTGAHQHIIIGHIGIGFGVVQVHSTHRACKERVLEALAKQLNMGVRGAALAQGVHVHADLGPLIIIADGRIAHALGTGAGDLVFAGHAVAHRAGLAVFSDALARIGQHFRISHNKISSFYSFSAGQTLSAALSAPIIARFSAVVKGFARFSVQSSEARNAGTCFLKKYNFFQKNP